MRSRPASRSSTGGQETPQRLPCSRAAVVRRAHRLVEGPARGFELFQGNQKVVRDPLADLAADARAHALCPPSPEPTGVESQQLCQNIAGEEGGGKERDWRWHESEIRQRDRAHRRVVDDKE